MSIASEHWSGVYQIYKVYYYLHTTIFKYKTHAGAGSFNLVPAWLSGFHNLATAAATRRSKATA